MKKFVSFFLAVSMLFSLCACGQGSGGSTATPAPAADSSEDAETESDAADDSAVAPDDADTAAGDSESSLDENLDALDALGDVDADRGLFDVSLTLPAEYVDEGTTQGSLDQEAKEHGWKSATLNEDGSVTYTITKAQHAEMMEEVKTSIDGAIEEMVGSENYPDITAIDANDDFTQFTVTVDAEELGMMDSMSVLAFYMYGGMYHIFNGTEVDNISVKFINAATGEVIEEANSADMASSDTSNVTANRQPVVYNCCLK